MSLKHRVVGVAMFPFLLGVMAVWSVWGFLDRVRAGLR